MKNITVDVINESVDVYAVEGDVGCTLQITNTPEEWEGCAIFALFVQGDSTYTALVKDNKSDKYNKVDIPPSFTDANKAFKVCVYAVGADMSRDIRPSIWIRVAESDFTVEDIEITGENIEDILALQSQYTEYYNAEQGRENAEKVRIANEKARIEAENNRKTELSDIKNRLSGAEAGINNLDNSKVDKVVGMGLSANNYSDHDCDKLGGIEYGAQVNEPVDQEYKSGSRYAQSGKAVAEAISTLLNGSPEALDTLYELAKALGNDPNFATTVMDAIGKKADKSNHSNGFEGGSGASAESGGGAVGEFAQSYGGGAIGNHTFAMGGGAIGFRAETGNGFAGGYNARTVTNDEGVAIDAIQLGTGQNTQPRTLQIYNYTLLDADGRIPAERMAVTPITEIPDTLSPNMTYHFSEVPSFISFPSDVVSKDGDVVYLAFRTYDAPTIAIDTTSIMGLDDIEFNANAMYEIYGKYNAGELTWFASYSEYLFEVGDADFGDMGEGWETA